MESLLHNEPVHVGDKVFDDIYGYGVVVAITSCGRIRVKTGKRIHEYSTDGFTGKFCSATLNWHRPPQIRFAKNECKARLQAEIVETMLKLMDELICADCPEPEVSCEPCDPEPSCCPEDPCKVDPLKINPIIKEWP